MHFKTMIGFAMLAPLACASPLLAQENAGRTAAEMPATLLAFNVPGLETVRRAAPRNAVTLAQAAEPQINDLQERIRQLNGKVEELNFQIIQMQDQMRKQQQDNEFRFEQLEKKRTDAGADAGTNVARSDAGSGARRDAGSSGGDVKSIIDGSGGASGGPPGGLGASGNPNGEKLGAPPRNFGTIKLDAKGDVVGETVSPGAASSRGAGRDGTMVAALPATDDPEELYRNSYQLILSGDYKAAETGFREHIKRYPNDQRAADAHFWLGEALLGQDRYRDAAQVFLDANKAYPKAKKAPDMLLKLGVSLSAMNQREVACGTYHSIGERYPRASAALKDRVKQEEALAGC
ncbi:MAG: tol-pal system protein YbgF [Hyphomicrobiales bacterium]|nr:tol-pal system protein YbgF [Hyphomicrobiales bacterium]